MVDEVLYVVDHRVALAVFVPDIPVIIPLGEIIQKGWLGLDGP